jgi:hypothetical protein
VPVRDLRLAHLPAEEDDLVAPARREVEQPLVEVLHLRAGGVDLPDAFGDPVGRTRDALRGVAHFARREITAVSRDPGHELGLPHLCLGELSALRDHALGERTDGAECHVRLVDGEEPRHHAAMITAAVGVGQRLREGRAAPRDVAVARTPRDAVGIFLWSRAAIWIGALFAFYWFEPNRHPNAARWDSPLLHDLGSATDVWARWDSAFFVRIAQHGYDHASAAFGPLYPALVWLVGHVFFGHYVLAGIVVSLAATLAAFVLLHATAERALGADGARRTVLYLALFPMALFLQAVYSESLFLALALAAFALAERGRWTGAGVVAGLAILTRIAGVAVLPGLSVLAWRSRDRASALARLALALPVAAVYPLVLWKQVGDPWAFAHAQDRWHRHFWPLGGVWQALVHWVPSGAGHAHALAVNAEDLFFLALFVPLTIVAWRRFGAPYGLFAAVSLAIPLSVPSSRWPLLSLPRFGLVIFPLFLALAALTAGRPRLHTAVIACSAFGLGIATVQWALWQWVA